ncbi:MAG: hypothetical protein ACE5HI_12565, partial [bacterium]
YFDLYKKPIAPWHLGPLASTFEHEKQAVKNNDYVLRGAKQSHNNHMKKRWEKKDENLCKER